MKKIKSVKTVGYDEYVSDFHKFALPGVEHIEEEKLKEASIEDCTALCQVCDYMCEEKAVDGTYHRFQFVLDVDDDNVLNIRYIGMN